MELLDTSAIVLITNKQDLITYMMIYTEHLNKSENAVRLNQKEGALLL